MQIKNKNYNYNYYYYNLYKVHNILLFIICLIGNLYNYMCCHGRNNATVATDTPFSSRKLKVETITTVRYIRYNLYDDLHTI